MPEESLLTDEVRALEGWTGPASLVRLTPRLAERAYEAIVGPEWAGTVRAGDVAPSYAIYALQAERMNHNREDPFPRLLPARQVIASEMIFERPLRAGEELLAQTRIGGIGERMGGRFGYTLTWQVRTEFLEPGGALAATIVQTFMQYDPAPEARP